ncbi:hypothetical protein BofuT4_P011310.1 [Botrytis cinerea T4]|uniref:Uncharacterized protein n=1 Tax=Botryotinia fuckeliana (strain T4) TaxID=999810 RepID=G2XS18_BOTF4|nr:hypothetical protein BofuT4_P011310.1 [Botrytis cinerea T4]
MVIEDSFHISSFGVMPMSRCINGGTTDPDSDLRNGITYFYSDILKRNQAVEASIDRKILQRLKGGKSNNEEPEIVVQSDGIPDMLLGKSTKGGDLSTLHEKSISDETSGWYTDDEEEAGVEWTTY